MACGQPPATGREVWIFPENNRRRNGIDLSRDSETAIRNTQKNAEGNMSMKKWTTWQLAPESDEQERLIVTTEDGETEITGIIPGEADARLIAAAPDLLDACIQLRDFFTREMDQGCALSLEEENAYNAANAAIAKALGDA